MTRNAAGTCQAPECGRGGQPPQQRRRQRQDHTARRCRTKEIEKLTALVQEGIGFNKERGDSVKVINAPFKVEALDKPESLPLWQQPWLLDLLRSGAVPAGLVLVALIIVSAWSSRPSRPPVPARPAPTEKGRQPAQRGGGRHAGAQHADLHRPAGARGTDRRDQARAGAPLAKGNPAAVANIVRAWVNGEEPSDRS
jgi:flagellar M-ring protein FliF